jgi:hypothetical protein
MHSSNSGFSDISDMATQEKRVFRQSPNCSQILVYPTWGRVALSTFSPGAIYRDIAPASRSSEDLFQVTAGLSSMMFSVWKGPTLGVEPRRGYAIAPSQEIPRMRVRRCKKRLMQSMA